MRCDAMLFCDSTQSIGARGTHEALALALVSEDAHPNLSWTLTSPDEPLAGAAIPSVIDAHPQAGRTRGVCMTRRWSRNRPALAP